MKIPTSIIKCDNNAELRWLIAYLFRHGYSKSNPSAATYADGFPNNLYVVIWDNGTKINTNLGMSAFDTKWIKKDSYSDEKAIFKVFTSLKAYLTSNRNITITGESLVWQFLEK